MRSGTLNPMKFEDLTVVYREERTKGLLSDVRVDLYPSMTALLATLKSDYERLLSEDPDSIMCEGANQRRRKAGRLVRDIVSMRMDKISCMALRASCGAQTSIDILTSEEKAFYDSVLEAARIHMGSIDRATGHVRYRIEPIEKSPKPAKPAVKTAAPAEEPSSLKDMPVMDDDFREFDSDVVAEEDFYNPYEESVQEPVPAVEPEIETEAEAQVEPSMPEEDVKEEIISSPARESVADSEDYDDEVVFIRILEDLPVFAGPDRDYDLKKEDLITMPRSMANALITREKAVLVKTSP